MHFEMQVTKFLLLVLLVVLGSQDGQFKELPSELRTFEVYFHNSLEPKSFTEIDKRNIKDVWNNIKNSITNAWDALKIFANSSRQKIKNMNQKVKARSQEVTASFEKRMNGLKKKINEVIRKIYDETEIVKKCLIEEKDSIENVINDILLHLNVCIAEALKNLSLLSGDSIRTINDTNFYIDLENKFEMCKQDVDNIEQCLNQVRKDIFNNLELMEADISKNRMESRNIADDLLETIIKCSIDAIIEASSSITHEVLQIAKCIMEG